MMKPSFGHSLQHRRLEGVGDRGEWVGSLGAATPQGQDRHPGLQCTCVARVGRNSRSQPAHTRVLTPCNAWDARSGRGAAINLPCVCIRPQPVGRQVIRVADLAGRSKAASMCRSGSPTNAINVDKSGIKKPSPGSIASNGHLTR